MAISVTHALVTAVPDDPAYDVGSDEWNAAHTVTGAVDKSGDTMTGTLTSTLGTVTADTPNWTGTVTWNSGAVTFTGIKYNVTNTASNAASTLVDIQLAGVSQFRIYASGVTEIAGKLGAVTGGLEFYTNQQARALIGAGTFTIYTNAGTTSQLNLGDSFDIAISRNGTTGQAEINNCSQGSYRDLLLRGLITNPVTVANLPTAVKGMRSFVTDSNATMTAGIGAVVAGGGTDNVPVYYDGTNWRIG